MAYGSNDEDRREFRREDITLAYQDLCLRLVSFALMLIYAFRTVLAFNAGNETIGFIVLALTLVAALLPFIPNWTHDYKHLGFISGIFFLSMEAFLSVKQGKHYSLFFFLIPLVITYCSFMSGIFYGILSGIIFMLEAALLIHLSQTAGFGEGEYHISLNDFFLHLLAAEILVTLVLFIFQHVLTKGEREIKAWRILRAKTSRRAALAEVLGKLAHEVNNPLAILHSAFIRYRQIQDEGRVSDLSRQQLLGYMQEGNHRIQNILDNLRTFAEGDLMEPMQAIDVRDLFAQLRQTSYERIRSSGAQLQIAPFSEGQTIHGRQKQIVFILSVLLDNALDAMIEEPRIVLLRFSTTDRVYRFEIEDNGVGIADDIADRIFQPFVSTKPFGQSMGMNLSICHGVAAEHHGQMGFIRKAKGTIFWLETAREPIA